MTLHQKYNLTKIISAAGSFTPLGVSRSSPGVGQAAAEALSEFFVMDELQDAASTAIADWTGAEAASVTHCVAAGITLGVAAAMAGGEPDGVAVLPDTSGLPSRVVLPAGSAVNYGHPLLQDLRLAGATPVLAGTDERCNIEDLETELAEPGTACLLLVASRLVRGELVDLAQGRIGGASPWSACDHRRRCTGYENTGPSRDRCRPDPDQRAQIPCLADRGIDYRTQGSGDGSAGA